MISFCNQAEALTEHTLQDFYHQKPEGLISKLHPNVIWIGAADKQCITGSEKVSAYIRNINVPRCEILNPDYQVIEGSRDICIVAGQMKVATSLESQELLCAVQRITFIWQRADSGVLLIHMHVSNPIEFQKKNEFFPHSAGKETFTYMKQILEQKQDRLVAQGKHNQTHVIWTKEILYIEAVNTDSIIHCLNRDILSREPISELEQKAGDEFIKIHRSFIVNSKYITGIDRYHLTVRQKTELPIPEKKYREIKEKVLNVVCNQQVWSYT